MLARQAQAFKPLHLFSGTPLTGCWKRTGCRGCLTERRKTLPPSHLGRGHRPCHSARLVPGAPASPPAGASRPPGRALASRGAWTCRSTGNRCARAGETHAFPGPARRRGGLDHAGMPGHSGRGHRPCHSATLTLGPPGAQSPRPAPAPPPAGAGRGFSRTCRSTGHRPARAGKRGAFSDPARTDESPFTAAMAGAIAPATAPRRPQARRGPKAPGQRPPRPRRALLARRVGRWPLLVRVAPVLVEAFRAGGANACVSCSRPKRRSPSPDREDFPRRQAVGLLFQHAIKPRFTMLRQSV
jgi:hypothetical protein